MNTALRSLPLLGIVMVAVSCDNVEWGGAQLSLRSASDDPVEVEGGVPLSDPIPAGDTVAAEPLGPVLYMGRRSGSQASLIPVAEIRADGLYALEVTSVEESRAFAADNVSAGSEFTLFADGRRVGRLSAVDFGVDERYCRPRPQITGPIELIPDASAVRTFLALPSQLGSTFEHGSYAPVPQTRDLRVVSLTMMQSIIPSVGAPWPLSVLGIRRDVQVFRANLGEAPTVVATFVNADSLDVGPAPRGAYSVFLVASDPDGAGYRTSYTDYRLASRDGKGTARYFDHLDLDRDGSPEIVLEVMGRNSMWVSALSRRDGAMQEAYRDPCGLPAPTRVTGAP
jgi:hypothetical protein